MLDSRRDRRVHSIDKGSVLDEISIISVLVYQLIDGCLVDMAIEHHS